MVKPLALELAPHLEIVHSLDKLSDATPSTDCTETWPSIANSSPVQSRPGSGDFDIFLDDHLDDLDLSEKDGGLQSGEGMCSSAFFASEVRMTDAVAIAGKPHSGGMLQFQQEVVAAIDCKENLGPGAPRVCKRIDNEVQPRRRKASSKKTRGAGDVVQGCRLNAGVHAPKCVTFMR